MRVKILVSDPWSLGEALGWRPLYGELVRMLDDDRGGRCLIELDSPVEHGGYSCSHLIASPRHAAGRVAGLHEGKVVMCGFTGVSRDTADADVDLELRGWRGGVAFTGSAEPSGGASDRCSGPPPFSRHK
jgi:hypothetical protein